MALTGTLRKVTINGISYRPAADTNVSQTPKYTIEGVPHSGGNNFKATRNPNQAEAVTLLVTTQEYGQLESLTDPQDTPDIFPMSYEKADGSSFVCQGRISLDNYESEEERCDVMMIPETEWSRFS